MEIKNVFKTSLKLGLVVAAVTWIIAYLINMLKIPTVTIVASTINVREQILAQGTSPVAGEKILSFLQGYIPMTLPSIIGLYIGAVVLVMIGTLLINWLPVLVVKLTRNEATNKTISLMFFGAIAITAILGGISGIGFWTTAVAMLIYYAIVAIVMGFVLNIKGVSNMLGL